MFKSIVVAFDGSLHACRGLEIGATLALGDKASLAIVYVIDTSHLQISPTIQKMAEIEQVIEPMPRLVTGFETAPIGLIGAMTRAASDAEKAMFQYAEFLIEQARAAAKQQGAEDIVTKVVLGSPAEEIVAFARERDADLIITGCRGLSQLNSLFLGSTSSKVTQLADCNCLTVK